MTPPLFEFGAGFVVVRGAGTSVMVGLGKSLEKVENG